MDFFISMAPDDWRNIFEALFLICFGLAWPSNVLKSFRARTAKNKSVMFVLFALSGYLFGITARIIGNAIDYPLVFYVINTCMVTADLCLYFRNRHLDNMADAHR
jgi:hypothetical protein